MAHRIDTKLIHAGEPSPRHQGAVSLPIYQSATFETTGEEKEYHEHRYARLSNTPNHLALHAKLAALEGAEAALVTASGMAAITTTLLALLRAGDHVLFHEVLYGGTRDFASRDFEPLGLSSDSIDATDPSGWKEKLRPTTRVVYVETITNPTMQVAEHEAVVAFAREHGLVSVVDNTFASPVNFRPAENGYDLSVHSATKYLNGHSDLIAGAVLGSDALIRKIALKLDHLGGSLDPHACFLLHRGIKTLALRVRQQNASALALARALEAHPAVERVHYPGLESSPSHQRARRYLDGFGGMLAVSLAGGLEAARAFCSRIRLGIFAPSLGGVETLVTRPAETSHSGMPRTQREALGISDGLVRISVGIEAVEDLIEDFTRALG
ncbi:MAG TPA: aminotransferase class I/II-fold pyridoxal phosphate-dependent enzyme [Thermoanaerobaculia bacterium]|nr:aminotransferase class I/II-fold pyridoxal phosphate-dependent enzyme [Thermoanaerobaculia bacterium]